jgi:hypothetical protein
MAALAGTMTYTGYLVVGVVADYLGTSRGIAGLLLGGLLARFPWITQGKPRIVGLLPQPARRPLIVGLLAICLWTLLSRGDVGPALLTGFTMAFVLTFPWLRRRLFGRMMSSFSTFAGNGRNDRSRTLDDGVIDGEFKEKKE